MLICATCSKGINELQANLKLISNSLKVNKRWVNKSVHKTSFGDIIYLKISWRVTKKVKNVKI